jgi:hypothetical protein
MIKSSEARFRANEEAASGREEAINHFSRNFKQAGERQAATEYMAMLIDNYGPVVDGYPFWHPFITEAGTPRSLAGWPDTLPKGFDGLDHTIYFRDAFVTAPYGGADRVWQSERLKTDGYCSAEEIVDVQLYNYGATPVLVKCEGIPKEDDGTISKRFALGKMLPTMLSGWEESKCGETWSTMRRYILGSPCGNRSSLFVNQDTGQALREAHAFLNRHGVFGPVYQG